MKDETANTIIIFAVIFACAAAIAGVINANSEHYVKIHAQAACYQRSI